MTNNFTQIRIKKTVKAQLDQLQARLSRLSVGPISHNTLQLWLVEIGKREVEKLEQVNVSIDAWAEQARRGPKKEQG